jgi:nitrite reductase/ring-hydroxylating ferredoxin subunit
MSDKADRRTILKAMAALPIAMTFGPLDYFKRQNARRLISDPAPSFVKGACVKFDSTIFAVPLVVMPFSVDIGDGQKVESFAVKLPDGRVVAYPARCPKLECSIKLKDKSDNHDAPILYCDCHDSVFDLNTGDVLEGPDRARLRPFKVKNCHQRICVIIEENYLPDFMT